MGRLHDAATAFLDDEGWAYEVQPAPPGRDGQRIHFRFTSETTQYDCWIVCYEETERLCVLALLPIVVPEPMRLPIAEYITRANYGIMVGNFELDFQDGEVRMKTSADVEDTPISHTFVRNLLVANLGTADRYFPGFVKVLYSNMEPADAIAVVRELQ
ncbi:MAG: YbjN domain-containing protein [Deltaproteobacteria bacterium]|nr:YbjN domain-containing protein [Deltaproteobacteria bacterium]